MKIKTFGWRKENLDQISRIEIGFKNLGHEVIDNGECDFIYSHDFTQMEEAYQYKLKYPNTKYFQKVLDLPIHLFETPYFNLEEIKQKLLRADKVLSNSFTVAKNIGNYLKLESHVIYDAINDIEKLEEKNRKWGEFIYVGRANDNNKRFNLIKETFKILGIDNTGLSVIGPDFPNFGRYYGIITTEKLNELYNSIPIIIFPSLIEGIGLPPIEAAICGCIPILCNDNQTAWEFWHPQLLCDSNAYSITGKIIDIRNNYEFYRNLILTHAERYKQQFNKNQIAQNIINIYENRR